MKIGLLGATGYFGSNILKYSNLKDNIETVDRKDFDLLDNLNFGVLNKYDVVVNCSALINQDRAHLDLDYRRKMMAVNGSSPIAIADNIKGKFVHISSYFVSDKNCNDYCLSKYLSHDSLRNRDNVLILTPAHPYGGINGNNYHSFLLKSQDKEMTLDNVNLFNIIEMERFVRAFDDMVNEDIYGTVLIYEYGVYNKYSMAVKLFGEKENWKLGKYNRDVAPRPLNTTFDNWKYEGDKDYVFHI